MPDDLTCIHAATGLCPACAADYAEDPSAWLEFGSHPAGLARWEAEQAAMAADAAAWAAEAQRAGRVDDESGIPF